MITDGAPNGLFTPLIGADPWVISDKFLEKDITLAVVGVGESILVCDDFYCALAAKSSNNRFFCYDYFYNGFLFIGGLYIPMVNFEEIFGSIVNSVCFEGDTFRQAFQQVKIDEIEKNSSFKYSYMKDRVNGMIKECETIDDIRKVFFNYYLFLH